MNNRYRFISLALAVVTVVSAFGQFQPPAPPAVGTKIVVRPEIAATAEEQIARARTKIAGLTGISDPSDRLAAMLGIMSNLGIVPMKWPDATEAVLESSVMQAELALQYSMPKHAIDVLNAALPRSAKTAYHVRVERTLARAHDRLGDASAAEAHLLAAERSPMLRQLNRLEASGVFQDLALLYSRNAKHREAIKRWRAASSLPGQPEAAKASLLLASLKDAVRLSDDPQRSEAKAAARELREAISAARKASKKDDRAIEAHQQDLDRLTKAFNL